MGGPSSDLSSQGWKIGPALVERAGSVAVASRASRDSAGPNLALNGLFAGDLSEKDMGIAG